MIAKTFGIDGIEVGKISQVSDEHLGRCHPIQPNSDKAREEKVLRRFIAVYCRANHGTTDGQLCDGPELSECARCLQDFRFSQGTPEKAVIRLLQVTRELSGVDLAPLVYWAQDRSKYLTRRRQATTGRTAGRAGKSATHGLRSG